MADEGLTQAEVAKRLGVTQGAVSQLLADPDRRPRLALACAIERESGAWQHGPIRTEEWLKADAA